MYVNLEKLVFVITNACPGKCAHCQVSSGAGRRGGALDPAAAEKALRALGGRHAIGSVLMFGGEPMLYPDAVCRLVSVAAELGIPGRGIITSGFVRADRDPETARHWAGELARAGIVNVLVSADAFHEVNIPFEPAYAFAGELKKRGVNVRLHPAWLQSAGADNPYNLRTRQVLAKFAPLALPISKGNVIFPSGNAAQNLGDYFVQPALSSFRAYRCGEAPYTSPLDDVGELHIAPNGDVLVCGFSIGNIHRADLADIVERYDPYADEDMALLMREGPYALYEKRLAQGAAVNTDGIYSACELCARACGARG